MLPRAADQWPKAASTTTAGNRPAALPSRIVTSSQVGQCTPDLDYQLIYQLGEGANGLVYLGQNMRDSTQFKAIKVAAHVARNLAEFESMQKLDHPNVVKVKAACRSGTQNDNTGHGWTFAL